MLNPNTYTSIDSVVGVSKVTSEAEMSEPNTRVSELIGAGIVFRVTASGKSGTNYRSYSFLVARDKIGTALDAVKGKTINGVSLSAGKIKRKATFY